MSMSKSNRIRELIRRIYDLNTTPEDRELARRWLEELAR